MVDARKVKLDDDATLEILSAAKVVHVCKGKQVLTFEPGKKDFDADAMLTAAMGRSGNLRAPTIRRGREVVVGWSEAGWDAIFES